MDITYQKNYRLISVNGDLKQYELSVEFMCQYIKLCKYYCVFESNEKNNEPKIINTTMRIFAAEDWSLGYATIIDPNHIIKHKFNFYKQSAKCFNKKFYQSITINTNSKEIK